MITAVDTSVLLDVFLPDETHGPQSKELLRSAYDRGAILVCDVVYAELVPAFGGRAILDQALREINATISPIEYLYRLRSWSALVAVPTGWRAQRADYFRLPDWAPTPLPAPTPFSHGTGGSTQPISPSWADRKPRGIRRDARGTI